MTELDTSGGQVLNTPVIELIDASKIHIKAINALSTRMTVLDTFLGHLHFLL